MCDFIAPADIADAKRAARQAARTVRAGINPTDAATLLPARFDAAFGQVPGGRVVAGYVAHGTELDPAPLLAHLAHLGAVIALPVVVGRDQPLMFRRYLPGEALIPGAYGIPEPPATAPPLRPDLVLVPLLAFDDRGHRLGYGAGYYDRTLTALRAGGPVRAVGIAYAAQRVAAVPADAYDAPLDGVLTELGWHPASR